MKNRRKTQGKNLKAVEGKRKEEPETKLIVPPGLKPLITEYEAHFNVSGKDYVAYYYRKDKYGK